LSKFSVNSIENKVTERKMLNRMSYREVSYIVGYLDA
jgi:hypothetical protein